MKTGHSNILNQDYIHDDSGILVTGDCIKYTPEEMKIIKGSSHDMMRGVHLMKKHFEMSEVIE